MARLDLAYGSDILFPLGACVLERILDNLAPNHLLEGFACSRLQVRCVTANKSAHTPISSNVTLTA